MYPMAQPILFAETGWRGAFLNVAGLIGFWAVKQFLLPYVRLFCSIYLLTSSSKSYY